MAFRVHFVDDGSVVTADLFPTPAAAKEAAAKALNDTGRKTRIARVVTEEWREREQARLDSGFHKKLPDWWLTAAWWVGSAPARDHFLHQSKSDPNKLAYTQSAEHGIADRQTVMTVTAYLGRYFGPDSDFRRLSSQDIQAIAAELHSENLELHMAFTPEEFDRIYRETPDVMNDSSGSRSCMRPDYLGGFFTDGTMEHLPSYVYGAGDLAIAWTENEHGEINTRAVVWPEKAQYVRLYGNRQSDTDKLRALLTKHGYKAADNLNGAKLLRIPHPKSDNPSYAGLFLMPYLDHNRGSGYYLRRLDDRHFVIDPNGTIRGDSTSGFAMDESLRAQSCQYCGDRGTDFQQVEGWFYCARHFESQTIVCPILGVRMLRVSGYQVRRLHDHRERWSREAMANHSVQCVFDRHHYSTFTDEERARLVEVVTGYHTAHYYEPETFVARRRVTLSRGMALASNAEGRVLRCEVSNRLFMRRPYCEFAQVDVIDVDGRIKKGVVIRENERLVEDCGFYRAKNGIFYVNALKRKRNKPVPVTAEQEMAE